MRLSKRLATIDSFIKPGFQAIWDCCCDHGLLGMQLVEREAADTIHFVDIVPALMDELTAKLTRYSPTQGAAHWQVHCIDVADIAINFQQRNLVIIAGVGGELLLRFINHILAAQQQFANINKGEILAELEFIICPVHHTYKVREGLLEQGMRLINEAIVCENNRFYEVIHISKQAKHRLTLTGSSMWHSGQPQHHCYQQKLLTHYQRMLNQNPIYYQHVINRYAQVLAPPA
ncbi:MULTISPECIES: tRNA (adenine(22)-N(1))-methyltransferase [Pseudoalteromonas]|uniref:tRNA (Adenine(22)-N(1))-methyltransferase TrmK n=1 Tax=Pseudoalteromonas haloplanktis TaxID=228 RepID=A0ABU1BGU8_PSEHA|nr:MULTISPECIES: tRNA (adenine(22)-N(1))-methyltransferase TrmK [Pseudoalteromonas]MCF6145222.1 tRNA (adenine22-N1)-methyltransferase [Pseudoalteromonas mariniglutinosa NCIMB 1770]MDQ9093482.1 tRNA (adenine(22)-N(1))-methyltransferase TrmK [Pseudoalteromonas haloplanktis]TMN71254.1 hypothetical protein CWB85_11960 [Pseudoalteromonas sp. S1727]BDF94798.1 SAM-dependent methyltransferase [Pseudoalteromonas sp. KAN5]